MSKELFTPIEFDVTIKEPKPRPIQTTGDTNFPDFETLKNAIYIIRQEMTRVENGTSPLREGSMNFPKGNNPAEATLQLLKTDCSEPVLQRFLDVAKQDYGARVSDFFIDTIRKAYPKLNRRKSSE